MAEELQEMVTRLGLLERVRFVGYVPHAQMPVFLESTDIFAVPSSASESFGVAALEASAMEVPVVATRSGGVPEVVVDGTTGILVKPRDASALAEALGALVEGAALRVQMGQAGRRDVLSRYRWEKNAARMAGLYEDLLQRWHSSS